MFFLLSPHFTTIIITITLPSCETFLSLSALKIRHQRQMSDIRDQFDIDKTRIDNREASNAQEIDTLHRKCICLTKL